MKRTMLLLLVVLSGAFGAVAQDVITLTNGTTVQSKVLEITPSEVKYKDFNNQDGPTNTILKTTVVSIQYANGVRTLFNESSSGDRPRSGNFVRGDNGDKSEEYKSSGSSQYKRKPGHGGVNGWYFGANLDIGGSNVVTSDPIYAPSSSSFSAANFLATYMFSPHIGIQFGVGDEVYSYNVDYNANSPYAGQSDVFTLTCFQIPVRGLYVSNSKERVGFYAQAGFDFAVVTLAKDNENENLTTSFNSGLVSLYASCGVNFRNRNDRLVWLLGPFYRTSFNNIYSANATNYITSGSPATIYSAGISLSAMWKHGGGRRGRY